MATTVAFSDLYTWLQNQPANTVDTPYELNITGLTVSDVGSNLTSGTLGNILSGLRNKYVDLSSTVLPSELRYMSSTFAGCRTLVYAPAIPNGVTEMSSTFSGCLVLKSAPVIPNSVNNMFGTFSGCLALVNAPVLPNSVRHCGSVFSNCSSLVYVPNIPSSTNYINVMFGGCSSLVIAPTIPSGVVEMADVFKNCTSLTTISFESFDSTNITSYTKVFQSCTNLVNFYCDQPYELKNWLSSMQSSDFPNSVSDCHFYLFSEPAEIPFSNLLNELFVLENNQDNGEPYKIKVTGLTANDIGESLTEGTLGNVILQSNIRHLIDLSETILPNNITDMTKGFYHCTALTASPQLPNSVTNLEKCFYLCGNLEKAPVIPPSVTNLSSAFLNCFSMVYAPNVPNSVTNFDRAFWNCTELEEIGEFDVPLSVLKTNAENCFDGCTSLTSIGIRKVDPTEASEWHAMRLNFGADNVSGKVYDKDKNTTTIPQTTIVKDTLTLPVKTDELWFPPSNMSDSDIDDVIEDVIDAKRTYFNKNVLNPSSKSFVLWKDSQSQFVSNIDFGGGGGSGIEVYPTEEDIIEDLPNLNDGDIVASYGDGEQFNDAPLGTITAYYGTTDPSNGKWLICDGRDTTGTTIELETHYPSLYLFLGGTNVLPDLREKVLVGAGQNETDSIANHDVYTVGQFKDDQFQGHEHNIRTSTTDSTGSYNDHGDSSSKNNPTRGIIEKSGYGTPRYGDTTHGKQQGVNYIIKATTTAEIRPLPSEGIAEIESFTTSYLANKLSNLLQVDHIWSTPITVASTTLTRTLDGYHFNDYDFIISEVSFYNDAQHNFMPIPKSSVQSSYGTGADFFIQGASTGGTDRRIGFTIDSDTTFRITMLNGTSGNMPKFQGFYGIKFNLT